jgi:hypothetical protein
MTSATSLSWELNLDAPVLVDSSCLRRGLATSQTTRPHRGN